MLFSFNALAEPININKANAETIAASLKGIGIKKAEAIVKYRKKNGSFKSLSDLGNVRGIGEKTLKNIAADVGLSKGKISKIKPAKKKIEKSANKNRKKEAKKTKKKTQDNKIKKSKKDDRKTEKKSDKKEK